MDETVAAILIKSGGAVAGAILALVFQKPKSWAELSTRAGFSIVSGLLFGDNVRDYLHWIDTWQRWASAAALTAMLSWFVMGAAVRIIGMWKPPKGE